MHTCISDCSQLTAFVTGEGEYCTHVHHTQAHTYVYTLIHTCTHAHMHIRLLSADCFRHGRTQILYKRTSCISTYVRICIHTYIHTYIHTHIYIHVRLLSTESISHGRLRILYIHTSYISTYVRICIHTYIHTCTYMSDCSQLTALVTGDCEYCTYIHHT